jgi:hypothetical protein
MVAPALGIGQLTELQQRCPVVQLDQGLEFT